MFDILLPYYTPMLQKRVRSYIMKGLKSARSGAAMTTMIVEFNFIRFFVHWLVHFNTGLYP